MVEGDAGAGEGMLDGGSDASGVAVSRDRNGAAIIHPNEGGAYVLRDGVGITPFRHLAVLYVPPNRRFGQRVLCLRKRHPRSTFDVGHSISHFRYFSFTITLFLNSVSKRTHFDDA